MNITISQTPQEVLDLRLEQTMSHQQIQALEMLTAPVMELSSIINREIESNPVLEAEFEQPDIATDDEVWLDHLMKLSDDNRYVCGTRSYSSPEDEERRQHFFESATYEPRLHERLLQELHFLDLTAAQQDRCEVVISSLDNDGFLTSHEADLAMVAGCSLPDVHAAIDIIQNLNPAGVGARDLRERLLLQLDRQGRRDTTTWHAVHDHLEDIGKNLLPKVARKLRISITELHQVIEDIKGLNPHISNEEVGPGDYVREEITIIEDDGLIDLRVNNDYLPSLRISKQYKALLNDPNTPPDVREWVKNKIRSAAYLINSVLQRQSTIERISRVIMDVQADFFRYGHDYMKPLTMAQVADIVGVHETTVSRAVAEKYLRCKYGLFPLKHFFSSGFVTEEGREVSSVAVKNAIRRLIEGEDAEKPLSDSQLAKELKEKGLNVARRTVAKYRESMNISSSSLRKAYCMA